MRRERNNPRKTPNTRRPTLVKLNPFSERHSLDASWAARENEMRAQRATITSTWICNQSMAKLTIKLGCDPLQVGYFTTVALLSTDRFAVVTVCSARWRKDTLTHERRKDRYLQPTRTRQHDQTNLFILRPVHRMNENGYEHAPYLGLLPVEWAIVRRPMFGPPGRTRTSLSLNDLINHLNCLASCAERKFDPSLRIV